MFFQLCEELVSLFGCIAHSHHSLSLSLVYDVLLSVAACYNRAVLVKVGSKLFFKLVLNIAQAEPIGPKGLLDLLVILPCTGNTIAKLANGITDSPVLMAAKAHLRNEKPLLLSISTNDAPVSYTHLTLPTTSRV